MGYFAEIDANNEVRRVVVAPSADWCVTNLGGTWLETADPYSPDPQVVVYCGPGYGADPGVPERFCSERWDASTATVQQQDPETGAWFWLHNTQGKLVFHNGKVWRNLMPDGNPNVWEPGVANWREYPMGAEHPVWLQPVGAVDAYPVDFVVEHAGKAWRSLVAANVWEPGAVGSENLWLDLTPAPEAPAVEAWQPWSGLNEDLYQIGDVVTHNGQTWTATVGDNHWEPGVFGWAVS